MKATLLGLLAGVLLVASAGAHALLGWPQFEGVLESAPLESDVIAALAVGWYFGSVSMLGFGAIVLHQTLRRLRGEPVQPGPVWAISVVYLLFGGAAYVLRDFNPHFLLFIGTGALVGLFGYFATVEVDSTERGRSR
jgi:hypothetical protein